MACPNVAQVFLRPSPSETRAGRVDDAARDPDPRREPLAELDGRLVALCRERGALRSVLARIAARLVFERAWERLGYARLSDYAGECLGLAGRSVRSLAEVGARFGELPGLEQALVSGTLGWTKVRLLARLPSGEDETRWIAHARCVTAEELSRAVRAVDRGSIEAGAGVEEGARGRLFEVCCTPEVRWKWVAARRAAARAAGRVLHVSEAAELIAAEVLSALPIDEEAQDGACDEAGTSWRDEAAVSWHDETESSRDADGSAPRALRANLPWRGPGVDGAGRAPAPPARSLPTPSLPPELELLLDGLDDQDPFELDERLRRALLLAQCIDARIGALLAPAWGGFLHRALGYASREAYARERLGMDPTRARALVRLERAASACAPFARGYRSGDLSWVKANALVPLLSADPLGSFIEDWVAWAERITLRRLREDVEQALALAETDPRAFRRGGGLPEQARGEADHEKREIGATVREPREPMSGGIASGVSVGRGHSGGGGFRREEVDAQDDREIGATAMELSELIDGVGVSVSGRGFSSTDDRGRNRELGATADFASRHPEPLKSAPDEVCWARFIGPPDVVELFRAVLCTVRRRIERHTGRLPTAGTALGVMVDHVLSSWGVLDEKVAARHRVFARDGWRCAVPGCTSLQTRPAGGGTRRA